MVYPSPFQALPGWLTRSAASILAAITSRHCSAVMTSSKLRGKPEGTVFVREFQRVYELASLQSPAEYHAVIPDIARAE